MDSERYQLINSSKLPGRLTPEETAWLLGFAAHDIPTLIAHGLLKPLGNPPPNGGRYFSSSEIERFRQDTKWLDKASALLIKHWKVKNDRKKPSSPKRHT
jgi:hypothetical protein